MVESWLQEFIDNGFDYCDVEPTTEAPHTRPDVSIPTRPGETTTEGTHTRPDVSIPTRPGETTTEGEESTDPIHLCDDPLWRNHGNPDPDQYNHLCGDMNLESCQDMDNWLEVQTHCPNQCSVVLGDVGLDQAAIDGAQGNCDIEVPPAQADCCDDPDYTYQDSPCEDQIGNCDVEEVMMHCPMTCQQSELPWNEVSDEWCHDWCKTDPDINPEDLCDDPNFAFRGVHCSANQWSSYLCTHYKDVTEHCQKTCSKYADEDPQVEAWLEEFINNGFDYCDVEPTTEAPHTRPDINIPTRPGETTTEGTHTRPDINIPTRPGETTTEGIHTRPDINIPTRPGETTTEGCDCECECDGCECCSDAAIAIEKAEEVKGTVQ